MEDLYPEFDVNAEQAPGKSLGLLGVAQADGVHERELALIGEVYQAAMESEVGASWAGGSVERAGALAPKELAPLLPAGAHRELFLKTAYMLAWADGQVSAAERTRIAEYAQALELGPDAQRRLEAEVKDQLLRPLAGLANVEAVSQVAKKLGL
jgi:hypothetical protein